MALPKVLKCINLKLLILKLCFFLVYSTWMSAAPYVSLITAHVIDFKQQAIIFSCIPAISVLSPIVIGFIADKMGNYKGLLIMAVLCSGVIFLPVLWLHVGYRELRQYLNNNHTAFDNSTLVTSSDVPQYTYTFPILIIVRIAGFIAFDAGNTLMDSCGLTMTQKHGGDFGRQKMWGTCGMVIIPILTGFLIDVISEYRGFTDYSVAFFLSAGFAVIVTPIMCNLDIQVQKNEQTILKTAKKVMGMIDVDCFLVAEIFIGFCWGFHMNFIGVYIHTELKSNKTLFGAAFGIGGLSSMIVMWFTKPIIRWVGEANTLSFSLLIYFIRFVIYYFLQTPWMILLTESIDGLTGVLSVVAGSYYCAAASPPGMLASLNGISKAATFGAGRGLGNTIGSLLISAYGIRFTYLVFGIIAGIVSATYFVINQIWLKKIEKKRLENKPSKENGVKNGEINLSAELNDDLVPPQPSVDIQSGSLPTLYTVPDSTTETSNSAKR